MRKMRNAYKILIGTPEGKILLKKPLGASGKIILKWVLQKLDVGMWTVFSLLRTGSSGGLL